MAPVLASDVQSHREWLHSLVPLPKAGLWVDLGCGTGADVVSVAQRHTGRSLRFVGLDGSATSIDAARANAGGDGRINFREHNLGTTLPLETASVDVAYSQNLVECLSDHEAFVREIARIVRPGGWLVMAHWDWDSQLFDGTDKARVRRLIHAFADWKQGWMDNADGWMGRRLWGTFNSTGLFKGTTYARVLTNTVYRESWFGHARAQDLRALVKRNLASAEEYENFVAEQEVLSAEGRYFYAITGFAYVAQAWAA